MEGMDITDADFQTGMKGVKEGEQIILMNCVWREGNGSVGVRWWNRYSEIEV